MNDKGSKKLLDLKEIRAKYNLTLYVLRKEINEGHIPAYQIGNGWMVFESDLEAWIQSCRLSVGVNKP